MSIPLKESLSMSPEQRRFLYPPVCPPPQCPSRGHSRRLASDPGHPPPAASSSFSRTGLNHSHFTAHLYEDACSGRENVVAGVLSLNDQIVAASLLVVQPLLQSDKTPVKLGEPSIIISFYRCDSYWLICLIRESHKNFICLLLFLLI